MSTPRTQREWEALFRATKAKGVSGKGARFRAFFDENGVARAERIEPEPPPPPPVYPDRRERVYFVRAATLRLIKIGVAGDLKLRLVGLQCGSPDRLEVIGTIVGANKLERELHKRFAHLRQHGEWFAPGEDLLAYIAEHVEK